jgi:hypothetical protein
MKQEHNGTNIYVSCIYRDIDNTSVRKKACKLLDGIKLEGIDRSDSQIEQLT